MEIFIILRVFVVIHTFVAGTKSLVCRSCQGDPEACAQSRKTQTCQYFPGDPNSTEICASYYTWDNGKATVQKMCKARASCLSDAAQKDNVCGIHDGKDKPCRCCCEKNHCNRLPKGCVVDSVCPRTKNLDNGFVECGESRKRGSRCNFNCNLGFELIGPKISRCMLDRRTGKLKWNNRGQYCVPTVRCLPVPKAPENGSMSCVNVHRHRDKSDLNYLWAKCSFACNVGFQIVGKAISRCRETGKWNADFPQCIARQCPSFPIAENRQTICTNGHLVNSICAFKCSKGYKLIGTTSVVCKSGSKDANTQEWTRDPPKCMRVKCEPIQQNPVNGKVKCTNKNFENSVCRYTCDAGYDLDATTDDVIKTMCEDDGGKDSLGKWSHAPARCTRITCMPEMTKPVNGKLSCTNRNYLNSECDIYCNIGHDLDDTGLKKVSSTCEADTDGDSFGIWSLTPPLDCSPISCKPRHIDPANGKVVCTQENRYGSTCTFRCDEFYDMDGTTNLTLSSTCVEGDNGEAIGKWTLAAPTCSLITCKAISSITNGQYACTSGNMKGSVCIFKCDIGYELNGVSIISCENRIAIGDNAAQWTAPQPSCARSYCNAQKYDNSMLGRECDKNGVGRFEIGTKCTYTCIKDGHYLVRTASSDDYVKFGNLVVECLGNKDWSSAPPRCLPLKCPTLPTPRNGYPPECSNGNFYLSKCDFQCHAKYVSTHNYSSICTGDKNKQDKFGIWSHRPPTCAGRECNEFPMVRHGSISYTNLHEIGSFARLNCHNGYTEKFLNESTCRAPSRSDMDPFWSRAKSMCCVRCFFNKKIKVVIAIDKTVANSADAWEDILTWYTNIMEYLFTNDFEINFGLILYDTEVDMGNSKRLRMIETAEDIYEIHDELFDAPYGGTGSDTGLALEYMWSTMFQIRKHEEPFLILIKNLESSTFFIEQAQRSRNEGLNILALGFANGNLSERKKHLVSIAGNERSAFLIEEINDLAKVGERIEHISKQKGCAIARKNRRCLR
ncbi:P-selectin-like [Styela clava]